MVPNDAMVAFERMGKIESIRSTVDNMLITLEDFDTAASVVEDYHGGMMTVN